MDYSKYRNEKITIDGHTFDSQKEGQRYLDLRLMLRAGVIRDLELQKRFVLQDGYVFQGRKVQPIAYIADFYYYDNEKKCYVVEDVKGFRTDMYKIKKKMFEYRYKMPIIEI